MATPKPPPRTHCHACGKRSYETELAAHAEVLRALVDSRVYLEEYRCPHAHGAGGWHVRNLEKRAATLRARGKGNLDARSQVNLARLRGITDRQDSDPKKALRRTQYSPSLGVQLHSLHAGRASRLRRHNKFRRPRRYRRGSPTARADCPQGGTVTKMLAWFNAKKFNRIDAMLGAMANHGKSDRLRRRNRKREKEVWLREAQREAAAVQRNA